MLTLLTRDARSFELANVASVKLRRHSRSSPWEKVSAVMTCFDAQGEVVTTVLAHEVLAYGLTEEENTMLRAVARQSSSGTDQCHIQQLAPR